MTPKQLKASILQLAIQGKLVPQDPNDEPASELLKRIETAKDAKSAKKKKTLPPITDDEKPFAIPDSWEWVRLGEICDFGSCENAVDSDICDDAWTLDLEDIEKDSGRILQRVLHSSRKSKGVRHVFKQGNVLFSKLRTYLNKVLIADEDGFCSSEILPLDFGVYVDNRYARCMLMSPMSLQYTRGCDYGVKMPRLGSEDGRMMPIPLPPLAEQKRIVEKVEALFKYVDECEDSRKELAENLSEALKRSILQEAIQGKLVPQDPNDEPASELLKRIEASSSFAKATEDRKGAKSAKKKKPLPPIADTEKPFAIPDSWEWVRLGSVATLSFSGRSPVYSIHSNANLTLGQRNNQEYGIDFTNIKYSTDEFIANYPKEWFLKDNDVLLNTLGNGTLGRVGIFIGESGKKYITDGHLFVFRFDDSATAWFVYYWFVTRRKIMEEICEGSTNQAFLKLPDVNSYAVPLPPLAEQKRIVEKVAALLSAVGRIKEGAES